MKKFGMVVGLIAVIILVCIIPVSGLSLPKNYIFIHDGGNEWVGNFYTWTAIGEIHGTYEGKITWLEHGWRVPTPFGQPQICNAYAEGEIALTNGTILHWKLGTPDDPYIFQKTRTIKGPIIQYYMRGYVYIDGVNMGYLDSVATGTWNTAILPY